MVWKHLAHQNVVRLLGVTANPLQLISDWMPGVNLMDYITTHPGADRLSLVGIPSTALYDAFTPSSVI